MALPKFTITSHLLVILLVLLFSSESSALLSCGPQHKYSQHRQHYQLHCLLGQIPWGFTPSKLQNNNPRCYSPVSLCTPVSSSSFVGYSCRSSPTFTIVSRHFASPIDDPEMDEVEIDEPESNDISLLARINSFLDTPILDANNKGDQGLISEALKDFVRDDPQLAQITFSGVLIVAFFVGLRLFNAIKYGAF